MFADLQLIQSSNTGNLATQMSYSFSGSASLPHVD